MATRTITGTKDAVTSSHGDVSVTLPGSRDWCFAWDDTKTLNLNAVLQSIAQQLRSSAAAKLI